MCVFTKWEISEWKRKKSSNNNRLLSENVTSIKVVFTFDFLWFFLFLFTLFLPLTSDDTRTRLDSVQYRRPIRYKCENIHEYLLCNSFVYSVSDHSFISFAWLFSSLSCRVSFSFQFDCNRLFIYLLYDFMAWSMIYFV